MIEVIDTYLLASLVRNQLKFHFPKNLKTYLSLLSASILTVIVIIFFLEVSEFLQHVFKDVISIYPLYGLLTPFVFALIVYFVSYYPGFIAGSGIPQVIASLESSNRSIRGRLLSFKIAFVKMICIFIAILFGAPIGTGGPSIHIGSSIFYQFNVFMRLRRKFLIHALITVGGCAGIVVIFNAPIAGIAFAYEEISRGVKKQAVFLIPFIIIVVYMLSTLIHGDKSHLVDLDISFDSRQIWKIMPLILVCSIMGGLFAKITVILVFKLKSLNRAKLVFTAFILGSIVAILNYLSDGLIAGTGHFEIVNMLNGASYSIEFVIGKFIAILSSLLSTIPGGIFMPSITIGGGIGSLFVDLLELDYQVILVFSMISYLAAVIRAPVTAVFVVLEMTSSLNLLIVGLIVAFSSSYISSKIQKKPLYLELTKAFL